MGIDPKRIHEVIVGCMYDDDEISEDAIVVEGVMHKIAFHPERLAAHKAEIKGFLQQLPGAFMRDGMSLMQMVVDKDGNHWGEQRDADVLYMLGNALGLARWALPPSMWKLLPGGMPYIIIQLD